MNQAESAMCFCIEFGIALHQDWTVVRLSSGSRLVKPQYLNDLASWSTIMYLVHPNFPCDMKRPSKFSADREDSTKLTRSQWSPEEVAIMVYFTSRQIRPKTLRYLLLRRGYDRSTRAIERKAFSITQQYPHLKAHRDWNLDVVDLWIDDLLGNHDSVNKLVLFSLADAEDVAHASCLLKPIQPCTNGVLVESTYWRTTETSQPSSYRHKGMTQISPTAVSLGLNGGIGETCPFQNNSQQPLSQSISYVLV